MEDEEKEEEEDDEDDDEDEDENEDEDVNVPRDTHNLSSEVSSSSVLTDSEEEQAWAPYDLRYASDSDVEAADTKIAHMDTTFDDKTRASSSMSFTSVLDNYINSSGIDYNVTTATKPKFNAASLLSRTTNESTMVTAFLEQLRVANEQLVAEKDAGTLSARQLEIEDEDAETDGQYIEMDLGLGVLEEQVSQTEDEDADVEDSEDQDENYLAKLMGKKKGEHKGIKIEEL